MLVVIAELVFSLSIDDSITEIVIRTTLVSLSLTPKAMLSIQYGEHISQIDNSERGADGTAVVLPSTEITPLSLLCWFIDDKLSQ